MKLGLRHFILYLIAFTVLAGCRSTSSVVPKAQKGVLDLRQWDFEQAGSLQLRGEWEFYWEELIDPKSSQNEDNKLLVPVPSNWNHYQYEGKKLPGTGFASYRLKVYLPENAPPLAFKLLTFGTAYELYVNGEKVGNNGKVGKNAQSVLPYALPQVCYLNQSEKELDIVLHIANFHHKNGGFWHGIRLGEKQQIQGSRDRLVALDLLIAGSLLVLAIYHFAIFLLRRQDRPALYFSLVAVLFCIRILLTDERYLLHLIPNFPWEVAFTLEYLTMYLGFPIYAMFFYEVYPKEFSKQALRVIQVVGVVLSLIVIITPTIIFSQTLFAVQGLWLFGGGYMLYVLVLATYRKREAARVFIAGFAILLFAIGNDTLNHYYLISTPYLTAYGFLIFVVSQSFVLSIRYATSFSKVEELTASLEKRVEKRTAEIMLQNQALEQQKDEITHKTQLIQKKNENITASINYASRIQQAILGSQEAVTSNFKESFIFLQPRDIVSGDFYWYTEVRRSKAIKDTDERKSIFFKVLVAADCTGHGIPGAFMTVLGNALLDEIINENKVTNPSRILSVLDRKLLMKLQKHNVNDGMDISILVFDSDNHQITFAGANNPLYYVRNGEITQIRGSKFPVGSSQYKRRKKFELHTIDYQEGDRFYICSDGFQDQFGGEEGRKYYKKFFREFLLSISHLPMTEQHQRLEAEFLRWKGDAPQTDDILVIGVEP